MYTPTFTINNKILKNIGAIEAAKQVIENAPLLPYWEKKFQDEALVRTTHYGTHIEGNELSLSQVQKVLDGERIVARDRDVQEVINYRNVLDYIDRRQDAKIDEDTILELHNIVVKNVLTPEEAGKYREKEVVIRNSITGDVAFKPPKAIEVPWQMRELVEFIGDEEEIHPVLKGGIVHYEFVRIHPFLDGNGRVGRALSMLMLYKLGYDIRQFFSLDGPLSNEADAIPAVIHETQTIVSGSTVKLRLLNEVNIAGRLVPKDNFIYGIASLNGERLTITIKDIRCDNAILPVSLSAYDMDGIEGIYIPGAISRDVARQSADNSLQQIGLNDLDPSIGMQAASAGVQAVKTILSKKIKLVKVTVKAGYKILLKDK